MTRLDGVLRSVLPPVAPLLLQRKGPLLHGQRPLAGGQAAGCEAAAPARIPFRRKGGASGEAAAGSAAAAAAAGEGSNVCRRADADKEADTKRSACSRGLPSALTLTARGAAEGPLTARLGEAGCMGPHDGAPQASQLRGLTTVDKEDQSSATAFTRKRQGPPLNRLPLQDPWVGKYNRQ
ncbi:hypothetical protein cyc_00693 [Cyclospora cayetanensis]|uniref:Uncharacterized protein n=1 Tax=Cyclospora cayetanensis TaxID=88456 RepID=A0A1D3CRC8_9EIME|nr:hypothetical protein cyc_00693 [Cyclospora cayetanensis]